MKRFAVALLFVASALLLSSVQCNNCIPYTIEDYALGPLPDPVQTMDFGTQDDAPNVSTQFSHSVFLIRFSVFSLRTRSTITMHIGPLMIAVLLLRAPMWILT